MKIQISNQKKIADALTIWDTPGNGIDIVTPLYDKIGVGSGIVKAAYIFNLFGKLSPDKHSIFAAELKRIMAENGELYIIENDFDYISRSFIGGDLKIEEFNNQFIQRSYLNQTLITEMLAEAGFKPDSMKVWFDATNFDRKLYEIVISAKND